MSNDWSAPEALGSEPPPPRNRHPSAYVIAVVVALLIAAGIVRIATHKSSKNNSSTQSTVGGHLPTPSPSSSGGPNIQLTPPIETPSPAPTGSDLGPPTSTTAGLVAAYHQVMARARGAGSMHSVTTSTTTENGQSLHVVFDDRDGATSGSQKISINGEIGQVRVVGKDSYFKGSAQVMAGFFGTTAQAAVADHDRWIHLVKGYRGYDSVTVNVTLSSSLDEVELSGPLIRVAPQQKNGVQAYGIRGHIAGANGSLFEATMWVAVSGNKLPVEFDESGPQQLTMVDRFSDWGAKVSLARPSNAVDGKHAFPAGGTNGGGGNGDGAGGGVPV